MGQEVAGSPVLMSDTTPEASALNHVINVVLDLAYCANKSWDVPVNPI